MITKLDLLIRTSQLKSILNINLHIVNKKVKKVNMYIHILISFVNYQKNSYNKI